MQRWATALLAWQLTAASEKHAHGSRSAHPVGGCRQETSAPVWTQIELLESGQEQEALARGEESPEPASKHHPGRQSESGRHGRVFAIHRHPRASAAQAAASRCAVQSADAPT